MNFHTHISFITYQPIRIVKRVSAFVARHGAMPQYDGAGGYTDLYI